ncbi:MAG: dihydrodipicolinate synthase family protein [Deltaproteobacteria bacterium]|nr:MAG: dihydrodipicolinate synthase family protein [Deltaproteobacteria bacterium]
MELKGVLPPITTPFQDGEIAIDKLKENFSLWNKTDLSGYLVLGSNGETVYLDREEKLRIVETAREMIPKEKIFMVGTGHESTIETIKFTNKVAEIGADYALVMNPSYFKGQMKKENLKAHFFKIAEESKIPILVYNVPQFTGINMDAELIAALSEHANIKGLKDSSGNIAQLSEIVALTGDDFKVFVGNATVFFPALSVGADGAILAIANVIPELCTKLYEHFNKGEWEEAKKLQQKLIPFSKAVTTIYGIGGLKKAMDMREYFGGEPRLPLLKPNKEGVERIERLLKELI